MLLVSLLLLACGAPEADDPGAGGGAAAPDGGAAGGAQDGGAGESEGADGGADGGPDGGTDGGEDLPSEYIYEDDPEQPGLTLDEVELAMGEAVLAFAAIDVGDYWSGYQQVIAQSDDGCPYYIPDYEELYGYWYWYDSCTAGTGASFSGYAYGVVSEPFWSGHYHYTDYGWMYGDFAADSADGQALDYSGYSYNYRYTYGAATAWYSSFTGDLRWTGPDYSGTWMEQSLSASFTRSAYEGTAGAPSVSVSGGVSNLPGVANALYFDGFWLGSAEAGSACPAEPSGVVSVRDEAGDWYEVLFHGPAESGGSAFPEDCDGCGEVWFRGALLGQACPSFAPLLDFGGGLR